MNLLRSRKLNGFALGISLTKGQKGWYLRIDFFKRSWVLGI